VWQFCFASYVRKKIRYFYIDDVTKTSLSDNDVMEKIFWTKYISHGERLRGVMHELSSPTQTLGSWVRIPLKHGFLCSFILFMFCV
jgi:hypothetical protein